MFSLSKLFLLITGIILVLSGAALFVLIYIGPVHNMSELKNIKSSNHLYMYSKKTYQIEMMACGGIAAFVGIISILAVFIEQKWLRFITIIIYVLLGLTALGMMGLYGYSYFFLLTASDSTMSSHLTQYENAFQCCGWKTSRDFPPCDSAVGYQQQLTCYNATQKVRSASLQNFISGGVYLLLTILLIIFIAIVTFCSGEVSNSYSKVDGEENVSDVID
ncbi:hypothetical protein KM1_034310 [Entamoeba histolytica HM-3:IMSS]|nr:hypothetical protein KM1_034310 [Entamoeba histolytica HM-3:IMSS]GAT97247.1 hypothetical protein CL6EHI_139380 [Entamoeba histolytica]